MSTATEPQAEYRAAEESSSFLTRALHLKKGELPFALLAFLLFFTIFSSYSVLRPVRDTMGIASGLNSLQWLFTATFLCSFAIQIPYFYVLGRISRRIILPVVFGFFALNLLGFSYALAHEINLVWVGRIFYVWLSVFNLLVISLGWSVLNDVLSAAESKRLFAIGAAGSSAGAMAGPLLTATLVRLTGLHALMIISVLLLCAAAVISQLLFYLRSRHPLPQSAAKPARLKAGIMEGLVSTFRSKYLLGIALFVILASTANTFLYFAQMHIVADSFKTKEEQTLVFSVIDLIVNTSTIALQLFVTGRLADRFGLKPLLSLVPALVALCFVVLMAAPVLTVIIAAMVVRRIGEYALVRPGKEMLFSAVSLDEKYKAKSFIDTVLYRGGDVASAFVTQFLSSLGGIVFSAAGGCVLALLWLGNALFLCRLYRHRTAVESPATQNSQA
ncbi:MAG: MFS transporter [Succinivibrio sp.]|nr:MFS transporter [Succinivibrio sp.]